MGAAAKVLELIKSEAPFGPRTPLILHAFTGPPKMIPIFNSLEGTMVYYGLGGLLSRIKRSKAERVAKEVPLDRILLETDAPDGWVRQGEGEEKEEEGGGEGKEEGCCGSSGNRSHNLNWPANLAADVLPLVASLRGTTQETLASASYQNACRVFKLL